MPELPEVETIRRQLEKEVVGAKIADVAVRFAGRLNVTGPTFVKTVRGVRIAAVGRRAKLLLIGLSNGWTIAVHLKMTGRFLLKPKGTAPGKHDHVIFSLADGRELFFEDVRKFGFLKLFKTDQLEAKVFSKEGYGPEPLEKGFTAKVLAACVLGRGPTKIKAKLMAQTCIAGIGNIYADESLWHAGIRPMRSVDSLKPAELERLHRAVVAILRESIRRQGTSADDYINLYGEKGTNSEKLEVYGRGGERCSRCGTKIKKITFAGRGTHYCPKCQK